MFIYSFQIILLYYMINTVRSQLMEKNRYGKTKPMES